MPAVSSKPLDDVWRNRLGLASRHAPDLFESADHVVDEPHALAIRTALDELGISAVFCVQGVPTVAILVTKDYNRAQIVDLHGALWNQGLVSLLLVITGDTLRAFSLVKQPYKDADESFDQRCLIDTLHQSADALRFRNLIYGAESGRLWKEYTSYFDPDERIDQVLLENLKQSHQLLCSEELSPDAAQALLMQAMFIAYLEDRGIITDEYFRAITNNDADSFLSLLSTKNIKLFRVLFTTLRTDFNGDLFVAPCSFESKSKAPEIKAMHLDILARFRTGREEMGKSGQQRFWGYDFRFIPIELVSAVYDRFLGEREDERRAHGAYYTPMFLADTVVSQAWSLLPEKTKHSGKFLDPSCGSGVFLVRSFQRLCEHWRATHSSKAIRWNSLLAILDRVYGWDINGSAVRVAVFSLYVALLEEVSPPDIRRLISHGKILPELWNKNLVCQDFFDADDKGFDVIIGNPPWSSRRGQGKSSTAWCAQNSFPIPGKEDAWAFAWKAMSHLANGGIVAFLLPAMGFLHNHADNTVSARAQFFEKTRVRRIINFADLRFQLFEHAHRPAALVVYEENKASQNPYSFDYWAPKADLNLQVKRLITLSTADKSCLSTNDTIANPLAFKQRLWMREPDGKLFAYLSRFSMIGDLVTDFGTLHRRRQEVDGKWVIGQGFQPFNGGESKSAPSYLMSQYVGKLPYLPIAAFGRLVQPTAGLKPWDTRRVRRKGFETGFKGPKILVPRGVETSNMRLRAVYSEDELTFQHIIQAIVIPRGKEEQGKLLAALLNSRVAVWYAFHGTASFGADRPEVQQAELLRLPFPKPDELPDEEKSAAAAKQLVALVDQGLRNTKASFALENEDQSLLKKIDRFAYQYFCLSDDEIVLIEDAVEKIIPAVQPHVGNYPDLWKAPTEADRRAYAATLVASVSDWFRGSGRISAHLEASSADLAILRLSLNGEPERYAESQNHAVTEALAHISEQIHQPLAGNFHLVPDLRVFAGKNLYLIKPMQLRFWLRVTALADADAIVMDLQDAVAMERRWSAN